MPALYEYQATVVEAIFNAFKDYPNVMLQMPTGTGKTTVFSEIINQQIKKREPRKKVLILVHRRELITQIEQRLKENPFRIFSGIISAGFKIESEKQVQIASIQTLKTIKKIDWLKNISLIIIDEAHHTPAESYQQIIGNYKNVGIKLLGVTATPSRLNGEGFNDYNILIKSLSVKEFIEQKYLAAYKHLATSLINLNEITINARDKDYDTGELEKVMSDKKIMAEIIDSYLKYGENKQAIIFGVNQNHSKNIARRFNDIGIRAEFIDSKTTKNIRDKIIDDFKSKKIKILCNVEIFTEGFDCPEIGVVQLARPTKSLVLYLQMIGRALRKKADGSQAIILDNAMLWKEHGLVSKDREWTLDGIKEQNYNTKAVRLETGEVEERHVNEIAGLDLEHVENIDAHNPDFGIAIKLIYKNAIVEEFEMSIRFPDYEKEVEKKLFRIKANKEYDEYEMRGVGFIIRNKIGFTQKLEVWKNEKIVFEIKQNGTIVTSLSWEDLEDDVQGKNKSNLSISADSNLLDLIKSHPYFKDKRDHNDEIKIHEFFKCTFIEFASKINEYVSYNADRNGIFENIAGSKDFSFTISSPYFRIDFDNIYPITEIKKYFSPRRNINWLDDIMIPLDVLKKINKKSWEKFYQIYNWMYLIK